MSTLKYAEIPNQIKLINSVSNIPIEYFKWGQHPDHFKIDMPHRHEFAEILFITEGGGVHEIGFKEYEIKKYSIHYIPKSTVHFLKRDTHSDGFTIAFDTDYLEQNNLHRFMNPLKIEPFALTLPERQFNSLMDHAKLLINRIHQEKGYYQQKCLLLSLQLLLNSVASECNNEKKHVRSCAEKSLLRDFKYLVQTNIHKHQNLSWYATKLNVSVKHLGNYIKKQLNESAKNYITKSLLFSIKQELINTNKSNTHIARDYNMDNSNLSNLFKKRVGYTLSEYRSGIKVDF